LLAQALGMGLNSIIGTLLLGSAGSLFSFANLLMVMIVHFIISSNCK
jgi:hypothetical protein